jgi:hypothetical protein
MTAFGVENFGQYAQRRRLTRLPGSAQDEVQPSSTHLRAAGRRGSGESM